MRLKGKKVLVYGLGSSGQEACRLLHSEGACVSLYDDDRRFSSLFCFEKKPQNQKYDLVVVSPGIKVIGNQIIDKLKEKCEVVSELDLGYSFVKGKIVAITGTNGKTTVCSLLGKIFSEAGKESFVCGNIGLPLSSVAKKTNKKSVSIVEVSNFQLELSKYFHPNVACVLNITDDHLDRHGCFEEYKSVKGKIFQNFNSRDIAIVNLDEEESLTIPFPKRRKFFSKRVLDKGTYVKNGFIFSGKKKIMLCTEVPLIGEKNLENVLCAISVARIFHIKPNIIRKAVASFNPPSHRIEFVGEINGAKVYDDSKSTNIACTLMAIEGLGDSSLILMLGGRNKDSNFEKLFSKNFKAKKVITFGECREEISKMAEKYNYDFESYQTMKEASYRVREIAEEGDVVLFSPACASFDEFSSYVARGQRFKEVIMGQE